jgi:6-phospho-beta-glucosidase
MRVAVIGAGSTYTPELVSGMDADELVLHDIDRERLDIVGGLASRMRGGITLTTDLDRALDGADFVLIQIRVGGQAARLEDETRPLACGCIGQETTGAGGLAKALRTVPVVLDIASRVPRETWIVDFTNPVGIVTRALLDAGHRAIGLCNVAIGFERAVARWLGVEPERIVVDQVGLNHLTWVRAVWVDGRDELPGLIETRELGWPRALLDELGAVPSYYLRYFYNHDEVLAAQRNGEVPRAQQVAEIERELLALYADPATTTKPKLLEQRGGAFYSEAATRLVRSLHSGDGATHVVDIRNHGTLAGLADDDVVEVPAKVDRDGAHPLPQRPLAPELLGLVQHVAAYERLAARGEERKALLAHPLVGQWAKVEALT